MEEWIRKGWAQWPSLFSQSLNGPFPLTGQLLSTPCASEMLTHRSSEAVRSETSGSHHGDDFHCDDTQLKEGTVSTSSSSSAPLRHQCKTRQGGRGESGTTMNDECTNEWKELLISFEMEKVLKVVPHWVLAYHVFWALRRDKDMRQMPSPSCRRSSARGRGWRTWVCSELISHHTHV